MTQAPNLYDYLARIGLTAPPPVTPDGLAQLQLAHRTAIGFENLDVRLGAGIAIDSRSVFDKLVTRQRGGYCFEHNRLFADMLAVLGFPNRPLLARVWLAAGPDAEPVPRTHVCLEVQIGGDPWIADAGFGGSYVPPLPLRDGAGAVSTDGARHRLVHVGAPGRIAGEWLLERAGPPEATDGRAAPHSDWQPQHSFDLGEVAQADLEQASHWTATRRGTRFTTLHVASIALPDGFAALSERRLTVHRGGKTEMREVADAAEYAAVLGDVFHIRLTLAEAARLPLFSD
jgi:N-hydroxyarylamine O-acetyltransferase